MNDYLSTGLTRRELLQLLSLSAASLALGAPVTSAGDSWWSGELKHLVPLASHDTVLIKCSFGSVPASAPVLRIDDREVAGERSDTAGRFWQFHAQGLDPAREYQLQLFDSNGKAQSDTWPLRTFPAPDAVVDRVRILTYTCAGGNQEMQLENGTKLFLPTAAKQKLLERGLSFSPDIVIANGDHIYWDQATSLNKGDMLAEPMQKLFAKYGHLDPSLPTLGTANEASLLAIADPQIADFYGVRLRSTPSYFVTDDHDLFENDEATDTLITLPPDRHQLDLARTTQSLYYPEYLPDANRPRWLAGSSAPDRREACSEVFGTLRYGQLLEALIYDTKRYATLKGPQATMFPVQVEKWLAMRTAAHETAQLLHVPSTPIGWSAGKWGEWYPDILQPDGRLGIARAKPYWPHGWWSQHQRILAILNAQKDRAPVIMSGDLHAFASGQISRSGSMDLADNPVNTLCVGPLGSGGPAFPSFIRGTPPQVPAQLALQQAFAPKEKNGFTLLDITRDNIAVKMFAWRPPEPIADISDLQPFHAYEIRR